ncbi:MAG: tyrosine-type recombinase/integrase [Bacteroidota bacterium]
MARLRQAKGHYYARFYDKTKTPTRKTVPLGTSNEEAAQAALKRLEVHYAEGRFDPWAPPQQAPVRLSEAIEAFFAAKAHRAPNTLRLYRTVLEGLYAYAGNQPVSEVKRDHILGFLNSRELNETGRHAYFTRLKAFFRWCAREGYVEEVVTDRVDVPKGPQVFPHWLSRDDFARLVHTMRQASDQSHGHEVIWLIPLVTVAVYTGLRVGELVALRWRDINLETRTLLVRHRAESKTKSRRDRAVPLARQAMEVLASLKQEDQNALVFRGARGGSINKEYASKCFLRYRRRAGLPSEIHFHSLRHTTASWLVQGGVSLLRVKEILGHVSIQTTMRYAHLAPSNMLEEVEQAMR